MSKFTEDFTMDELTDTETAEMAKLVGGGCTSGRLDSEESSIYWEIRWNKWAE